MRRVRDPMAGAAWRLVVDGATLAVLREAVAFDQFWFALHVEPLGGAPDPRLSEPGFWLGDTWRLVDESTGATEPHVFAATRPLEDDGRVRLRGFLPR